MSRHQSCALEPIFQRETNDNILLLARLHIGGQTSNGCWRLASSVTLNGGPAGGFTAENAVQRKADCGKRFFAFVRSVLLV